MNNNWDATRNDIDDILSFYVFEYNRKKNRYDMLGLPDGYHISFEKVIINDGRKCIYVSWEKNKNDDFRGSSMPCYDKETVKDHLKKFREITFENVQQLSIFDL